MPKKIIHFMWKPLLRIINTSFFIIYRSPKSAEEGDVTLYSEIKTCHQKQNAVTCGDFNNPPVSWDIFTLDEGKRLVDFAEEAFLYKIIGMPTRGGNILGLIFTNESDFIYTCKMDEPLANSDNDIIRCILNLQTKEKGNLLLTPNFRKANFTATRIELQPIDWNLHIEDMCRKFLDLLESS